MRFVMPVALSLVATLIAVAVAVLIARATVLHAPALPTEEPS